MTPANDPKGLVRESYLIDGISDGECRSILIDWALSLPQDIDQRKAMQDLLTQYAPTAPDHPMTALLNEGISRPPAPPRGRRRRA